MESSSSCRIRRSCLSKAIITVVLLLQLSATTLQGQFAERPRAEEEVLECFCNAGESCMDNICNVSGRGKCVTTVLRLENGAPHVEWLCQEEFLTCADLYNGGYVQDCCDDKHFCNRCPQNIDRLINHFSITEEELAGLNFTAECVEGYLNRSRVAKTTPTPAPATTQFVEQSDRIWFEVVVGLAVTLVFVVSLVSVLVLICCFIKWRKCLSRSGDVVGMKVDISFDDPDPSTNLSSAITSQNMRYQTNSLAKMLQLRKKIATGGFGEVWKADHDRDDYAVKIFRSRKYEDWKREGEIYNTCRLVHPSIVRFWFMDINDTGLNVDYWLVFDYHQHGSLSTYLSNNTLSDLECLQFLLSIASGLNYLHQNIPTSYPTSSTAIAANCNTCGKSIPPSFCSTCGEIASTSGGLANSVSFAPAGGKPVVAHRDLKPSNILIKDNGTCCIADLGLAVTSKNFLDKSKLPNPQQGTKRYMAPEILKGSIDAKCIDSYVMADVYAYSLLMWELAMRCHWSNDEVPPYEPVYHNVVPSDPCIEDMKKKVVDEGVRPPLDPAWKNNEILSSVSSMMQECWREQPDSRLSIMHVRKNLFDLADEMKQGVFKTNE